MAIFNKQIVRIGVIALILAFFLGIGLLWNTNQNQDIFGADQITERTFPSLTYSVQTFLWWDDGYTGLTLDLVQMMGFNTIKQSFAWRDLEAIQGEWNFANPERFLAEVEARNINVIARLGQVPDWSVSSGRVGVSSDKADAPPDNLDDWANYCRTVAQEFKGRIVAYQIWNEPNLSREWGNREPDAVEYVDLLRICSEAIREVDEDVILISAGLAPTGTQDETAHRDDIYLDAMYQANFQQYIDVVGVHAPGFSVPTYGPDDAERDGQGRWATFRRVEDLRKIMLQYDDGARQMAILEVGWTTDTVNPDYAWFAVTEEQQAQYITEAYAYALENWSPWIGVVSLIYMPSSAWTSDQEEWWWAIIKPPRTNRPAFDALIHMSKQCDDFIIPALPTGLSEEEFRERLTSCP